MNDMDNFGKGADGTNIEFACLFTHVMPTKILLNHFNFESGSHDLAEGEQEFKGYLNIGQAVEKFAADQMSASKVYKFYNESDMLNLSTYASSVPDA